jgi:ABC-type oligopeptide transport system substrate-binding subunit
MALLGFSADYPDPEAFMRPLLGSRGVGTTNFQYFASPQFDRLLQRASAMSGKSRYAAFTNLDRLTMRDAAPVAPIINTNGRIYVSESVGCFTYALVAGAVNLAAVCKK